MNLYTRKARDLSTDLFNSVYSDLFALAARQQERLWRAAKGKRRAYRVGEAQDLLDAFCAGEANLGNALDFIRAHSR